MPHDHPDTIAVNDAAAMVPVGSRRFRQLAALETEDGKKKLGLTYLGGRAHINRDAAMTVVEDLRAARNTGKYRPQDNLKFFTERNRRDPLTNARLCLIEDCNAHVAGRGKLCLVHSLEQAKRRAARRAERNNR
jgi:hypothetical protein